MRRGDYLLSLAAFLLAIFCAAAEAGRPGTCSAELERRLAELERVRTDLRLRTAELRVTRGQLSACEARQ